MEDLVVESTLKRISLNQPVRQVFLRLIIERDRFTRGISTACWLEIPEKITVDA